MRFLVTGCGRSGTKYTAQLLTAAGLHCGHEDVFNSWPRGKPPPRWRESPFDGDSSFVAAPWAGELARHLVVVHQVRAPLDVIRSAVGTGHTEDRRKPWVAYIDGQIGHLRRPTPAQRAATYWLRWNRLVAPHAHLTWRLDTIGADDVQALAKRIGVDLDPNRVAEALERTPTTTNHRERDETIGLTDLGPLADKVIVAAERYGVPLEVDRG